MIRVVPAGTGAYLEPALALRVHAVLGRVLPEAPLDVVGAGCWVRVHLARALGGLNELDRFHLILDNAVIRVVKAGPRDSGKAVRLLARFDRILEAALA